jgi:hypothetical protein
MFNVATALSCDFNRPAVAAFLTANGLIFDLVCRRRFCRVLG